jgi:hypothetical protein
LENGLPFLVGYEWRKLFDPRPDPVPECTMTQAPDGPPAHVGKYE